MPDELLRTPSSTRRRGVAFWVKATFDDTDAIVHVEDNGEGIAPELLPRVFYMFTQADTATSGGGLGIGLALVHELVRLHGGSVQAVSLGLDRGSEFTVRLPLQCIAASGDKTPAAEAYAGATLRSSDAFLTASPSARA
jgi:K+-sensing histidine kinase KdpD